MDADDDVLASDLGVPELQAASPPTWQPSYNTTTNWRPNLHYWQPQGHIAACSVDTRTWKGAHFDLDAKPNVSGRGRTVRELI